MIRWSTPAWLLAAFTLVACADPPNKEMDQAQGALDAAHAAGADRYATTELTAARKALDDARAAVTAGDYRLALNHALDSRERAQNAAREAANTKAQLRGGVERSMAEIAPRLASANSRLHTAQRARPAARTLRGPTDDLAAANADVQKAGEAVKADDYMAAREAVERAQRRIAAADAALDAITQTQSRRLRR